MPTDCVPGGLAELSGRWFVRDPEALFALSYPRYEARCGQARVAGFEVDHDRSDGYAVHAWSDGTHLFHHASSIFDDGVFQFEYAWIQGICVRADGTLGGAWAEASTDVPVLGGIMIGTPFGPKDERSPALEHVGELGTSTKGQPILAFNLVVDGGLAYVIGPHGLEIIDVTDPTAPIALGHLDGFGWNDVRVTHVEGRSIAYAAGGETAIIDVTDPDFPVALGSLPDAHSLQLSGDRLYLANYSWEVPVYDVANPVSPTLVGFAPLADSSPIHDLTVDGDRLFVNATTGGFAVIDLAAGMDAAHEVARMPGPAYSHASAVGTAGGRRLALHGDEGLTADGAALLRVLDGDPASPSFLAELGRYQSRPEVGIHNFVMAGDRAYLAYYQDGVRVVDLADPTDPREVAHYNTLDLETAPGSPFEGAFSIRVVDGLIYVADSERGLVILRE
jgi:hypothetical protein